MLSSTLVETVGLLLHDEGEDSLFSTCVEMIESYEQSTTLCTDKTNHQVRSPKETRAGAEDPLLVEVTPLQG